MITPNVVQFTGFTTTIDAAAFTEQWKEYSKVFEGKTSHTTLWRQVHTRGRYAFLSLQHWPVDDVRFNFMGGGRHDYFPDRTVRVIQTGGYMESTEQHLLNPAREPAMVIFAFVKDAVLDVAALQQLPGVTACREYQAFFESCVYSQVFELATTESDMPALLAQLRTREGVETAVYARCPVGRQRPATAKKVTG